MPSKNKKQLNFFLLVKAYKENGEIGVKRQFNHLEGYKPRLTVDYMNKLIKTANTIQPADLIDMTSGIEGDNVLGDKKDLKVGYWALFRGKFKPAGSINEMPQENEFIAQIKRVDNSKGVVNFNQNGFRNKYGNTMVIPRRANISNPDFIYLDYALFDNVIKTGKTPQEVAKPREALAESIELKSKSHKGNRLFDMLKTAKFQHYDSPKGELSTLNRGEEDRKRIVSKLGKADKKTYREWVKTPEGQKSLKRFEDFTSPLFKEKEKIEESIRKSVRKILKENLEISDEPKQHEKDYDAGYLSSKWMYEKDDESKKRMFINDAYESLTGFFGNIEHNKIAGVLKTIGNIFDKAMQKKYDHGVGTAIMNKEETEYTRQFYNLAAKFDTNDIETIHGLIDNIFNGE